MTFLRNTVFGFLMSVCAMHADIVVFTFGNPSSLVSAAGSAATGSAAVTEVQNSSLPVPSIINVSGGEFTFTTASRASSNAVLAQFNAGGTWTITGNVTVGSTSISGTLAQGTFTGTPNLANPLNNRNAFNANIQVTSVNVDLLALLQIMTVVPDPSSSVTLARSGTYTAGAFANANSTDPVDPIGTQGTLSFFGNAIPEPSTNVLMGLGAALVGWRLRRSRQSR